MRGLEGDAKVLRNCAEDLEKLEKGSEEQGECGGSRKSTLEDRTDVERRGSS